MFKPREPSDARFFRMGEFPALTSFEHVFYYYPEQNDFRTHIMKYERKNSEQLNYLTSSCSNRGLLADLAVTRLQAIFRVCLLRRRKDSKLDGQRLIELPDKTYHLDELTFCEEEQRIYNMIQDRSRACSHS